MRVLVVEDDEAIRSFLVDLLSDEGVAVTAAADGEQALAMLRQQPEPICLILLDLMMPTMNGWELRAALRGDPGLAHIPVVVLSARSDLGQLAEQWPDAEVVAKPVNVDQLLEVVSRHCNCNEAQGSRG